MKSNIVSIILEAQRQLVLKPIDLAHDIAHHYRVYEGVLKIIYNENLDIDKDFLAVCAWYHDLGGRRGEDTVLIRRLISKHMDDNKFIDKVVDIIREHSFGETQSSLESKVLFDADKLEYVNPFRLLWFLRAYNDHFINEKTYRQYKNEWGERVQKLKSMLHFNYSQEKFMQFLPKAKEIMKD